MANTTAFQTQDSLAHIALNWARELNRVMMEYNISIEHMLEVAKHRGCVGGLHIEVDCSDFYLDNATLVHRDSLVVVSYTDALGWVVV